MSYLDKFDDDILFNIGSYLPINDQINLYFVTHDNSYVKDLINNIKNNYKCQSCHNNNHPAKCDRCKKKLCNDCIIMYSPFIDDRYACKLCKDCSENMHCGECERTMMFDLPFTLCFECKKIYCQDCSYDWDCNICNLVICNNCVCKTCSSCFNCKKVICSNCILFEGIDKQEIFNVCTDCQNLYCNTCSHDRKYTTCNKDLCDECFKRNGSSCCSSNT